MKDQALWRGLSFVVLFWLGATHSGEASSLGTNGPQLVSDGGFENVNFGVKDGFPYTGAIGDGWTVTENGVNIYSGTSATNNLYSAHSGTQFAFLGDVDFNGTHLNTLSQTLATTVGQDYTVSFWAKGVAPGNLLVNFGDQVLYDGAGRTRSSTDYELFTYVVQATSASTPLTFIGSNSNFGYGVSLDDVSVVPGDFPNSNPNPVPEPSSWMIAVSAVALRLSRRPARRPDK